MRTLVTGGSGFIGSHLVDRLLIDGHDVTVYDLKPSDSVAHQVIGDLLAGERLQEALDGQDVVFHFAANADVRGGAQDTTRDLQQNLMATQILLEHMRQAEIKHLAFASTSSVYGDTKVVPTPENCPMPHATSLYGASKIAAEALISAYCHAFDMRATIFRFVPVVGERYQHGNLWDFYRKLKADPMCIEILGDGKQRRSVVYVDDVINAISTAMMVDSVERVRVFNVGTYSAPTIDCVLDWVCETMGVKPERAYTGKSWAGDRPYVLLDCSRLRALGWMPKVDVHEAVVRTVRSFDA